MVAAKDCGKRVKAWPTMYDLLLRVLSLIRLSSL